MLYLNKQFLIWGEVMIVYQETKEQFLLDVYNDKIDEKIEKLVFERLNRRTGYSEYQTWMNSMQYMYKVL